MSATVSCRPLAVLSLWLGRVALLLGCACGASAPAERRTAGAYVPAEIQPALGESIISKGSLDTSNGALVQFSEYTSTLFYRAWLLQAIADVERRGTD